MALETPLAGDGNPGGSVAGRLDVDLDEAELVQGPDYVGAIRETVRGTVRRGVRGPPCGRSYPSTRGRSASCTRIVL